MNGRFRKFISFLEEVRNIRQGIEQEQRDFLFKRKNEKDEEDSLNLVKFLFKTPGSAN